MFTTSSLDWKQMEEPKDSGPVLDMMVQSLPSSSTIPSDWSISSSHTMPKPPTKLEVMKEIPEPEIDLIDGVTFRSFESWQEMLEYTQKEERNRKMAQTKKSTMSGNKRKSENRSGSSDPSKTKSRLSLDSALKAVNNKSNSTKSAFVSDLLDDYLNQTKKDLKGKQYRNPEYFGAPPEDSKIYSTGILNMDSVKKKPFPALPKVSNVTENSKPDSSNKDKCSLKRSRDDSLANRVRPSKVKADKAKPSGSSELSENREVVFNELMAATFADIQSRKRQCNPSIKMDELYVRFAMETVRTPSKNSPRLKMEEKDDASDVAKMISRHSKRDIRLPARYHNSNIMIGNEWVTASVDPVSEKKGRKRLVEEQKRLFRMMEQVQCPSPKKKKSSDAPSARMIKELHTKVKLDRELQKPKPEKEPLQKKPEKEPLQKKSEKEPLQKVETCISTSTIAKPSALPPDPVISSPGKSVMGSQIKVINQELKELYRNLYFENVPERRIHFQMKGIKPRVNKHQAVEEAIEVLEKLKKRESQLAYIHKLMSIWNNKLELCRKVMMKEVEPEPTPDGKNYVNVVANVLKAYQSSICYKVQEALTKNECQEDLNQQKLTTKAMDHLSSPRIITSASKKDVIQNDDSSKALISPNESQPRIIGYRPLKKNALVAESSIAKSAPGKNGLIAETSIGKSVPIMNGKKRGRSESGNSNGKSESLLLPRQVAANVIHITAESYTSRPVKMIRLAGPRGLNLTSGKGFISVTPASFKSTSNGPIVQLDPKECSISVTPASFKSTSNGPIVQLDPKECSPNAFAIKLNGPPVGASGQQVFTTLKKKPGNLVPVPHPIPTGPLENTVADAARPSIEAVTLL